jgi:hypothetical protein
VHVGESVDHYLAEPRSFPATEPDCGFHTAVFET